MLLEKRIIRVGKRLTSNRREGRNFHLLIIVHNANAPNATPPTTHTTIIAVFVPEDMPVVPAAASAAALAVAETDAVLIDTEPVRAPRVDEEGVGMTEAAGSVTVLRTVEMI